MLYSLSTEAVINLREELIEEKEEDYQLSDEKEFEYTRLIMECNLELMIREGHEVNFYKHKKFN